MKEWLILWHHIFRNMSHRKLEKKARSQPIHIAPSDSQNDEILVIRVNDVSFLLSARLPKVVWECENMCHSIADLELLFFKVFLKKLIDKKSTEK